MSYVLAFVALVGLAALHELVQSHAARTQRPAMAIVIAAVAHYTAIAAPGFDASNKLTAGDRIVTINGVSVAGTNVRDIIGVRQQREYAART